MKYRKLRIAWSVAWGLVAVLLVTSWIRSYEFNDVLQGSFGRGSGFAITSLEGRINLTTMAVPGSLPWNVSSQPLEDWPRFQIPLWPPGRQFGIERHADHTHIGARHWFFVAFSMALVATPWLRFLKRFSLRTLLVVTTLVAVVLGAIVYAIG